MFLMGICPFSLEDLTLDSQERLPNGLLQKNNVNIKFYMWNIAGAITCERQHDRDYI